MASPVTKEKRKELDALLIEFSALRAQTKRHHHEAWCDYRECALCQRRDEIVESIQFDIDLSTDAIHRLADLSGL